MYKKVILLVLILLVGRQAPAQVSTGDVNCDGVAGDIQDLVYLVSYMFQQGPAPCSIPSTVIAFDQLKTQRAISRILGDGLEPSTS